VWLPPLLTSFRGQPPSPYSSTGCVWIYKSGVAGILSTFSLLTLPLRYLCSTSLILRKTQSILTATIGYGLRSHEYDGTQPGRFSACHAERQMALFAYKHQFARDELVDDVDLLGFSLVHSPQRLKWATILVSTFCKISEGDCSRNCIKRLLFVLVSADL
jgi:hypothetical protein